MNRAPAGTILFEDTSGQVGEGDAKENTPSQEEEVGDGGAKKANEEAGGGGPEADPPTDEQMAANKQATAQFRAFCVGLSHAGIAGMNATSIPGHVKTMVALLNAGDEAGLHRYQKQISSGHRVNLDQKMGGMEGNAAPAGAPSLSLFAGKEATTEAVTGAVNAIKANSEAATFLNNKFKLNLADDEGKAAVCLGLMCQDGTDVVRFGR